MKIWNVIIRFRSSPHSPAQAVSSTPSTPMPQESSVTSRSGDTPDRGGNNLTSGQPMDESDNSVFDGGGGNNNNNNNNNPTSNSNNNNNNNSNSNANSNRPESNNCMQSMVHRSSPSSQYNASPSPNHQQQTSPRPRAPSVPPHLLTQFWSQAPNVQGFATQRLLNGVISSAVSYVTGNNGAAAGNVNVTGNNGTSVGTNVSSANTTSGEFSGSFVYGVSG